MRSFLFLLLFFSLSASQSASRGFTVEYKTSEAIDAAIAGSMQLYSNSYARVIGIDDYSNGTQQFAPSITEKNHYSSKDNNLRAEVSQRIQVLQQAARREQQQVAQLASLSSTNGDALSSKVKACDECPEMVLIPAGSFRMGDLNGGGYGHEKPVHRVDIQSLAMGKYEVTFAEYDAFARATIRDLPADEGWGRGNRPVTNVSWEDVNIYVQWLARKTGLSFRLPTEAEWEYAARAGTDTKHNWGNDKGGKNANCKGCPSQEEKKQTAPVGSFAANAFGLHDVHGNVLEWVEDCYKDSYSGASPTGLAHQDSACSYRVLRGGSWIDTVSGLRSANRYWYPPSRRGTNLGFRVAQDLN